MHFPRQVGIQTFNKYFISALEDISSGDNNMSAEIVGIYDDENDVRPTLPFIGSSKIQAFRYIFANAKKFDTFIFAHVNLAPLAMALHLLNPKARIIFCTHGIEIWKKLPKPTEWIMNGSTVLTVSNFSMNELKRYNLKLNDVRLFPNCMIKKLTDPSKLHALGWKHTVELHEGIEKMYAWYIGERGSVIREA
jgi:hypothetical protein